MERGGCNVYFEVRYWHYLDRNRKITKDFSQLGDSQAKNRSRYVRDIIQNLCSSTYTFTSKYHQFYRYPYQLLNKYTAHFNSTVPTKKNVNNRRSFEWRNKPFVYSVILLKKLQVDIFRHIEYSITHQINEDIRLRFTGDISHA